jgi:hypothetical protein
MASIAPSERLRRELDEIIDGARDDADPIEAIGRLGATVDPAAGARGRGERVPRSRSLRASRRADRTSKRLRAGDDEDDRWAARAGAAAAAQCVAA